MVTLKVRLFVGSLVWCHLDLRVAAVKSTWSTCLLQVKSSPFSSKSAPKFSTQVAAEFLDKSHDL